MANLQSPEFVSHKVADCSSLNEVLETVYPHGSEYKSGRHQDNVLDRLTNACHGHYGQQFVDRLTDVRHSLADDFCKSERVVTAPNGATWTVSDTYDLLQPVEAFAVMQPVLDKYPGHTFKRAGLLQGGRKLFVEVNIGSFEVPPYGQRKVGDVLDKNVTLFTGFDGGTATDIAESLLRVWCDNGCASWKRQSGVRSKHTSNQRERLQAAINHLTDSRNVFADLAAKLSSYAVTPMSNEQAKAAIASVVSGTSTRSDNMRTAIVNEFRNAERGAFGETAFDLLNAFTAYQSHETNYRNTRTASGSENRFATLSGLGANNMAAIVKAIDLALAA